MVLFLILLFLKKLLKKILTHLFLKKTNQKNFNTPFFEKKVGSKNLANSKNFGLLAMKASETLETQSFARFLLS